MNTRSQRNSKIELLRFLFCAVIIIYHFNNPYFGDETKFLGASPLTLAASGDICVEFFFLVSGWLLGKKLASYDGIQSSAVEYGKDTGLFLWRKVKPILPYHLITCGILLCIWLAILPFASCLERFIDRLPSLFFLHRVGILGEESKDFIGVEWYISSMLIAMLFLYPLGRRFKKNFRVFAPFAGLLIIGSLMAQKERINNVYDLLGFTYECNFRAVGEILIGIGTYEISQVLIRKKETHDKLVKIGFSLTELLCYAIAFRFAFSDASCQYFPLILIALAIGVTLSFSKAGILSETRLFNNRFFDYLGRLSLPCYISQVLFVSYLPTYLKKTTLTETDQVYILFFANILFGVILLAFVGSVGSKQKKRLPRILLAGFLLLLCSAGIVWLIRALKTGTLRF